MGDKKNMDALSHYYDGDNNLIGNPYLVKKLKKRKYLSQLEKRDLLASPGDFIESCYLIEEGALIAYEISSGNRRIFDCYEKNTMVFCEHAIIDRPSCFYYEALESTAMYEISIEKVKKLLVKDIMFARCFFSQLTRDFLVTQDLFRKTINHSARWRVCDFLLVFAARASVKQNGKIILNQRISQQLLADMLYINRITALREIHALEEAGLCQMRNGHFEISDLEKLKKYRDACV